MPAADPPPDRKPELRETRFTLRTLLQEVADELRNGASGREKLRSAEVRKLFRGKPAKSRASEN